jgi:chromosome segregation ATPase
VATWAAERPVARLAVELLGVVENVAGGARTVVNEIDPRLEKMQGISTRIADASGQLSQNVTDKGLILVLLPEEQEQQLVELSRSVAEIVQTTRDILTTAMDLYRSIDRLPFISLPARDQDQAEALAQSVAETQASAEAIRQEIVAFRTGASDRIGEVEQEANGVSQRLGESRERLAQLDANLAALQDRAARLQGTIPTLLALGAVLVTLFLAYVIYTQVEMIRLFVQRWRCLGDAPAALPDEAETG